MEENKELRSWKRADKEEFEAWWSTHLDRIINFVIYSEAQSVYKAIALYVFLHFKEISHDGKR